jgi:hypothetical protein
MNTTPSVRSLALDFDNPTFFVPLWPAPMPSTARPFEMIERSNRRGADCWMPRQYAVD